MTAKAMLILAVVLGLAAAPAVAGGCPLDDAKDNQVITLRGRVVHAPGHTGDVSPPLPPPQAARF